jgi:hypothetical protein
MYLVGAIAAVNFISRWLPDGTRALIPAAWTNLPIAQYESSASPQRGQAAFLASHADLLHARAIVNALLRQFPVVNTPLPPAAEDSHAATELSRPSRSGRGRTRVVGPR